MGQRIVSRPICRLTAALAVAAAIALSLSANAASSVRYGQHYTGAETAQFLAHAGAHGPVLLDVQNHPFDQAVVDRVVAQSASEALSMPIQFTPDPALAAEPSWRYVLVFNPPDSAGIGDACAGHVMPQPRASSLEVLASLCQGSRAFAGARGTTLRAVSAQDPGLARLVAEVTTTVFSASDIDKRGPGHAPANVGRPARALISTRGWRQTTSPADRPRGTPVLRPTRAAPGSIFLGAIVLSWRGSTWRGTESELSLAAN